MRPHRSRHDPDGLRLPIKLDSTSNGEFAPVPLEPVHHHARQLALEAATHNARRLGESRRSFLVSLCGAASTLLAMNTAFLAGCKRGGRYGVPRPRMQVIGHSTSPGDRGSVPRRSRGFQCAAVLHGPAGRHAARGP